MGEDKRNMVQQLFKAQIALSEVLGRLHFNTTAAFSGWYEVLATEAAIFKRDGRPI